MKLLRTDRVLFYWTEKNNKKYNAEIAGNKFTEYAILILEDMLVDKVFDVHYTVNNGEKKKLCYYNF